MSFLGSFDLIILFFFLGLIASWMKSDLEIPQQVSKFLSIFILLSIGLKGGHEVRVAENYSNFIPLLLLGIGTCLTIPIVIFFIAKKTLGLANAAALASSYGSVSAVTFVTAKSVILLIGGFLIGLALNDISWKGISPFIKDNFKGLLAFFLLDLGIQAQKQLSDAFKHKLTAATIALLFPIAIGTITLIIGHILGLPSGDKILISVLAGSASYIAAPATIRYSIPTANLSLYLALPLTITFPMNLIFGVHFYMFLNERLINISNTTIVLI